ncbi:tyrosine-type recombinase/integrase [Victivallis vadensis]|uniref:tyrosine-type recombinase/integrase n=1 Tax=Victivallis vadensis TaxID=172901 RepID=UPI0023F90D47|nr:hypothetical protein [Victivallis vadensis]
MVNGYTIPEFFMALKKIGKIYHIRYFSLDRRDTLLTTGETDREKAIAVHDIFMAKLKYLRQMQRRRIALGEVPGEAQGNAIADIAVHTQRRRKRYTFDEAFELYKSHVSPLPENAEKNFYRFAKWAGKRYVDEITPELAYNYLLENYADSAGKTWNNNKNSLNAIFRRIVIPAGLPASPFANVPGKPNKGEHQRPFSDEEFLAIFANADLLWRSAAFISYWTGFRQESCFRLGPSHIQDDIITLMPGKTARFNRSVRIPVHPQLKAYLQQLPPSFDDTFLGFDQRKRSGGAFSRYFGELLEKLGIHDTTEGLACFGSIRNNFIDRCRRAKLPDHAIRGMVGQTSEEMTDLYSHEVESAMPLKDLPFLKLKP